MKYILNSNIALRSWQKVPWAYYERNVLTAKGLKKEEYELLKLCDGMHELESSQLLESLMQRGLCHAAKEGGTLDEWQQEKVCSNRYFPAMNWMITGRCNYNCLHCFNAADNGVIQSEFTLAEAYRLVEEAKTCGINAFTITGGEPMLHPHFMDIVRAIYANGMYIQELNTNGHFITQELLDELQEVGCSPLVKISFDGVGWHDWLRNRAGAEEDALRAMKLCVDNGFPVKVQTNVHRKNISSMPDTMKRLNDAGVKEMRIIRTSESPRWISNAGDACLTLEEYFEESLLLLKEYGKLNCRMMLDIWQFVHVDPIRRTYRPTAFTCLDGEYRDSLVVCRSNRGLVAVASDGSLYPCHQMSGYYRKHGISLGNVKEDGLQKHLQEGAYLDSVCTTVKQLARRNDECAACRWFKHCCGGCRAIGLALTDDMYAPDKSKCLFFQGGYLDRLKEALSGCPEGRQYSSEA